jgi:RNA polymerase sigma-54 factor
MRAQLDPEDPDHELLVRMLEEFLEPISRNALPRVARALSISIEDLKVLIERLSRLQPRPAAALCEQGAPRVVADVVVAPNQAGGFEITINQSWAPSVSIDPRMRALSKDRSQPREVRAYLRGKLERARWIVDSLEQRGRTLLRVALALCERQRAFLEQGRRHLLPLRMNEVAEELGLHASTVSRAVAGKHIQTPHGILPLRDLFPSAAGEDLGAPRGELLEAVREVFAREDRRVPLSDDEAVEALRRRGFALARRTLAKYRRELGIQSSYRRRLYGSSAQP